MRRNPLSTAAWSTVICCAAGPPFDQFLNVYLRPLLSVMVEAAETLWIEPIAHVNSGGDGPLVGAPSGKGRVVGVVGKNPGAPGREGGGGGTKNAGVVFGFFTRFHAPLSPPFAYPPS